MSLQKTRHPRPKRVGKNSTLGEKTAVKTHTALAQLFGGRTILKIVGFVGAVIIVTGGLVLYKTMYIKPERVFWGMISNNLSTYSITKEISQSGESATNNEYTQLAFTPSPRVRDIKEITTQNAANTSKIKIESIGTPSDTYQHYVLIDQSSKEGKPKPDYSKVYSMWLKNSGNDQSETQLFNNVAFSAVLFGNLSMSDRDTAIKYLHDSYKVDFSNVKKESNDGRKTYTFSAKVSLRNYAKAANFYAKSLGLPNANQIKADNYKESDQADIKFTVDVLSRQLRKVEYVGGGSSETYTTYGIVANFKTPTQTVSYEELQKTVQKAATQ